MIKAKTGAAHRGVTLIELLIVVVIIAILGAIAVPAYSKFSAKGKRVTAKEALSERMQKLERCYSEFLTYSTDKCSLHLTNSWTDKVPPEPNNPYYQLSASNVSASGYTLTATAFNGQESDDDCLTLSINHLGEPSSTRADGTDSTKVCW